jgi:hypothetical protein
MNKAFEKILERLEKEFGISDEVVIELYDIKKIVQEVAEEFAPDTNVGSSGWIPVKTRPMTEEEEEYYSEYFFIYECPLPDDGQEVLITSKYGNVDKTTFYKDDGNYFEDYEDYDEVVAWKALPEPYKESED